MDNKKFLNPEKPIFIVGCPRSGTTVLTVHLGRHSQIVTPPETHFFECITHLWPPGVRKEPMSNNAIKRLINNSRMNKLELSVFDLDKFLDRTDRSHRDVFCSLMECYRAKTGKQFWCEKTPRHLFYAEKICKLFPNAKIINIIRDGRDVAHSLKKTPWRENNIGTQAHEWKEYAIQALKIKEKLSNQNFLTVFFEDFINNPHNVLCNICDFIGLDFESEMIHSPGNKSNFHAVHDSELKWKSKAKQNVDNSRISAWKNECNKGDIALMNYIMGPSLKEFGYNDTDIFFDKNRVKLSLKSNTALLLKYPLNFLSKYAPRFRTKKHLKFLNF